MRLAATVALALGLTGCVGLNLSRHERADHESGFSAPTERGDRYVVVEGGPLSTPASLTRRWAREAKKGCGGEDYLVLSDASFTRRQGGAIAKRFHEGYVRCVVSDPDPAPKGQGADPRPTASRAPSP